MQELRQSHVYRILKSIKKVIPLKTSYFSLEVKKMLQSQKYTLTTHSKDIVLKSNI